MDKEILTTLGELRPEVDFTSSTDFVADGLLDSLDIVGLVGALEVLYDVRIDGLDVVSENFVSVGSIRDLITRTRNAK